MKQFALIGLSTFSRRIIEELEDLSCDLLLIDKDPEVIELYKDRVTRSFVADVLNEETIRQLIPVDINGVILDPGDRIEVSILVTNYLKKMGVKNIFVRAETDDHGEILNLVGADHVIYPNREAAKRIAPMLLTSRLSNYLPIGNGLVIAEVKAPAGLYGKNLIEANLRRTKNVNVVAIRNGDSHDEYQFQSPEYRIQADDIFLLAGPEDVVHAMAGMGAADTDRGLVKLYRKLFRP